MKYLEEEYSGHPLETIQHKLTEGEKDTARALIAWADNHGRPQTGITGSGFANTNRWVKQTPDLYELGCSPDPTDSLKIPG